MVLLYKMKTLFKPRADFIALLLWFAFFIICNLIFNIPIQSDDFDYAYQVNVLKVPLSQFYEFNRSPIEGFVLYNLYKLIGVGTSWMSTNIVFYFYYSIHFFTAWFIYLLLKRFFLYINIKASFNVSFFVALLFLFQQPAIELFANVSYGIRLISGFFMILFLYMQLLQVKNVTFIRTIFSGVFFLLSVIFYEVNIYFFVIPFLFPIIIDYRTGSLVQFFAKALKQYSLFYAHLFVSGIVSLLFLMRYFVSTYVNKSSDSTFELMHIVKRLLLYIGQFFIPNLHGALFWFSIMYCFFVAGVFFLLLLNYKKLSRLVMLLMGSLFAVWFLFIVGLSFAPYFAPRLLYVPNGIFLTWLMIALNQLIVIYPLKRYLFNGICMLIITSSIVNCLHFFMLQDVTHQVYQRVIDQVNLANNNRCHDVYIFTNHYLPVRLVYEPNATKDISSYYRTEYGQSFCHNVYVKNDLVIADSKTNLLEAIRLRLFSGFFQSQPYKVIVN